MRTDKNPRGKTLRDKPHPICHIFPHTLTYAVHSFRREPMHISNSTDTVRRLITVAGQRCPRNATQQGSDTRVRTQKTGGFFWVHPPKKPTPKTHTSTLT